jgi:hypothetical protein
VVLFWVRSVDMPVGNGRAMERNQE